jgi:chorismate mutase
MDRLNARLRDLLQARARLAVDIARWKQRQGIAAPDPAREEEMLRRVLRDAIPGFDRAELRRLFVVIFRASRRLAVQATRPPRSPRAGRTSR